MTEQAPLRLTAISGSLRRDSLNTRALEAARRLAPGGVTLERLDITSIPLYNDDVYAAGFPPPVQRLREAIATADGVLIVTPEYNYSVPGVLKNAIDWASRPPDQPFDGKPVAIMGASPGRLGTARAQYHLRQCFVFLNGHVLNRPEVMIAGAGQAFDANGDFAEPATRDLVAALLHALAAACRGERAGGG